MLHPTFRYDLGVDPGGSGGYPTTRVSKTRIATRMGGGVSYRQQRQGRQPSWSLGAAPRGLPTRVKRGSCCGDERSCRESASGDLRDGHPNANGPRISRGLRGGRAGLWRRRSSLSRRPTQAWGRGEHRPTCCAFGDRGSRLAWWLAARLRKGRWV